MKYGLLDSQKPWFPELQFTIPPGVFELISRVLVKIKSQFLFNPLTLKFKKYILPTW